ncbi:hypothetical protein [Amycolatopsis sp. WAC 04169]|uniref:DUF6973 domain-containing protein n=1 Tax=Amycolatopsis sp. WAC 04169 TaxID=2203197 RepID=UPI001F2B52E2|nr:hypothetical protein [Amycolatopsis sp. WAC 04169]
MKTIDDTEQAVRDLVRSVETTADFAAKNGFRIDNGKVVETEGASGFLSTMLLQVEVEATLARSGQIDTELNSVLKRIMAGEIGDAGATTLAAAAAASEDRIADEQRHRDLLAKYQVKTDGTTVWPSGLTGWLAERAGFSKEKITQSEAKLLDDLQMRKGLLGLKEFADIRQDALHVAEGKFEGKGLTDGHADAFRHAYWNAMGRSGTGRNGPATSPRRTSGTRAAITSRWPWTCTTTKSAARSPGPTRTPVPSRWRT